MPTVMQAARITTPAGSVWRACTGCGRLTAMPPGEIDCPGCRINDLAADLDRATHELLYAIETRDGERLIQALDRLRRQLSPVLADGVLRGLIASGRLTVTGGGRR